MISVCMTTYNGEKFLTRQLDSILCQMTEDTELIIMDDASNDGTQEILKIYCEVDKRIKVFFNDTNLGHIQNFSNALEKCSGEIIFLCDQDDIWLDNKISNSVKYLKDNQNVFCFISNAQIINEDDMITTDSYFSFANSGSGLIKNFIKKDRLSVIKTME